MMENKYLTRENEEAEETEVIEGPTIQEIQEIEKEVKPSFDDVGDDINDDFKRYIYDISHFPVLTPEEEIELAKKVQAGDTSAKKRFIECNLKLVVSISTRFNKHSNYLLDLVQEGNIGLMKAVELFDWTKGYKFSTYATWWIRHYMIRFLKNHIRTVRLPVHLNEQVQQIYKAQSYLMQVNNRNPSIEEIALFINSPVGKVKELLIVSQEIFSLDTPIGEECNIFLGDCIQEPSCVQEKVYSSLLRDELDKVLSYLKPTESRVLKLRYGLDDGYSRTLEEIAKEFGISRERIRQIEAKALRRIRNSLSGNLKEFWLPA